MSLPQIQQNNGAGLLTVKSIVMDELRSQYPEKFNESGAMDYQWFEADIRPNYNVFIRLDVKSISFSFGVGPHLDKGEAVAFLNSYVFPQEETNGQE